jgi:hypothetical protein
MQPSGSACVLQVVLIAWVVYPNELGGVLSRWWIDALVPETALFAAARE